VWYKSDINFRFYAAILDFGLLQHWRQWKVGILEIAITFKPFNRSFRNLVTNFGPTRAITRNVQIYQKFKMAAVGRRPSWISSNPYNFWTAWSILSKFGGQLRTHKGYYRKCSNLPKSKMAAVGRRSSWILQIPITFEPLDRSFRNLVANFGATGVLPAMFIFLNPRWWLQDGSHFDFYTDSLWMNLCLATVVSVRVCVCVCV
jgi:hypothetical protein